MGREGAERWPGVAAYHDSAILLQGKLKAGEGGV